MGPPDAPDRPVGTRPGPLRVLGQVIRRMGWFYLSALIVAAGSLWGFASLAEGVLARTFDSVNHQILDVVLTLRRPWLDRLALAITALGSSTGATVIGGLFILWLWSRRRWLDAAVFGIVMAGGSLLTVELKARFGHPRPALWAPLASEPTFSFPSGHAVISVCLFGYIAIWLVAGAPRARWRRAGAGALVLLAAAVALSRVYVGVHWPTDVVAGVLVGVFWLTVGWTGRRWLAGRVGGSGER